MNIRKNLIIIFNGPKKVLIAGLVALNEDYYRRKLEKKYKKSRLETLDILDLFPNLEEELDVYSFLYGTSLISDLILLKSLSKKFPDGEYLEIGSWRGESLAAVHKDIKHCTSVTLSSEELRKMNMHENVIKAHGFFSKDIKNLTEVFQNSQTFDFTTLNKKFDLIFVDGDHTYEGVLNDTKKIFDLRNDKKSIIVWHDYSYGIEDVRYATLKAILDGIPKEKHKNLYHVSNTICAVYIEDCNLKTRIISPPEIPNNRFSIKMKGIKI